MRRTKQKKTSVGKRDPEGEIVGVTSSMVTDGSPKAWAVNTLHNLVINKLFSHKCNKVWTYKKL